MPLLIVAAHARPSLILPALLSVAFVSEQEGSKIPGVKFSLVQNSVINLKGNVVAFEGRHGHNVYDMAVLNSVLKQSPHHKLTIGAQFREWIPSVTRLTSAEPEVYIPALHELDAHLIFNSYIIGQSLTLADLVAWGALRDHEVAFTDMQDSFENVNRWYKQVQEDHAWINNIVLYLRAFNDRTALAIKSPPSPQPQATSPINSTGVVVRFCPKFAGYTHIGHAKSALLNDHFAHERHQGKFICRFDDTMPSKQMTRFQASLAQDLKALGIVPDKKSFASDYFEDIEKHIIELIRGGHAFADILDEVTVRNEKGDKTPSQYRCMSIEDTIAWFEEIQAGSYKGARRCIRAKTPFVDGEENVRDPIIYRPASVSHERRGVKFKAFPSYELAMAVIDAVEGVTHAILDDETPALNADYTWFQTTLGLHKCEVLEYPHLKLNRSHWTTNKIAHLVSGGSIRSGWDHLRRPTLKEMMRRGLIVPALREFCLMRSSKGGNEQSTWNALWMVNTKHLESQSPRFAAIDKSFMVVAEIRNGPRTAHWKRMYRNRQNPELGTKYVAYSRHVLIGQSEVAHLETGEQVHLKDWGDALVREKATCSNGSETIVTKLALELISKKPTESNESMVIVSSPTSTSSSSAASQSSGSRSSSSSSVKQGRQLTWLAIESHGLVPMELFDFENKATHSAVSTMGPPTPTFSVTSSSADEPASPAHGFLNLDFEFRCEAIGDCNLADLCDGEPVYLEGKGYFRVDRAYKDGEPAVLFSIPTGIEEHTQLAKVVPPT